MWGTAIEAKIAYTAKQRGGTGRWFCKIQARLISTQLHLKVSELTISFSQVSSLAKSHKNVYKEIQ